MCDCACMESRPKLMTLQQTPALCWRSVQCRASWTNYWAGVPQAMDSRVARQTSGLYQPALLLLVLQQSANIITGSRNRNKNWTQVFSNNQLFLALTGALYIMVRYPHAGYFMRFSVSPTPDIYPISWFRWFRETPDNFESSAERLYEKAKTIKLGFERWSHHCPSTYENTQPLSQLPRNTCVSRNHSDTMHLKDKCPFFKK